MEKMLKKLLASALAIALLLTALNVTVFADDGPANAAIATDGEPAPETATGPAAEAVENETEPVTEEPAPEPTAEPVAAVMSVGAPAPVSTEPSAPAAQTSEPAAQPPVDPATCAHGRLTRASGGSVGPTCSEHGYTIEQMKCSECGAIISEWKEYQNDTLKDHVYEEKKIEGQCVGQPTVVKVCKNCGKYETVVEGGHDWVKHTEQVACSGPSEWEECSYCHMRRNEKFSTLYTHTFNEGKEEILTEATCTSYGWKRLTCDCGKSERIEMIPKLGHAWDSETGIEEAANCEHGTRKVRTCSLCGATEVVEEADDCLGHRWTVDAEKCKDATCQHVGKKAELCTRCGKTRETTVPLQPHKGDRVAKDAQTHHRVCEWCGVEYALEDHNFGDPVLNAAGTATFHKCINCGYDEKVADVHKHTWEWKHDETSHWEVCSDVNCNEEEEQRWQHVWTWIDGDCTKGKVCSVCGRTDTQAAYAEHTFTAWALDTNNGSQTHSRRCTICGKTETAKHEYEWKTTRTPTPEQMGLEVGTCTVCGSQATRDLLKTDPTPKPTPEPTPEPTPTPEKTEEPGEITPSEPTPNPGEVTPSEPDEVTPGEANPTTKPGEVTPGEPTEKPTEEPKATPTPSEVTPGEPTEEPTEEPNPTPTPSEVTPGEATEEPTEEPEPTPTPEVTPSEPDEVTPGEATEEPTEEPEPTPTPEVTPGEPNEVTPDEATQDEATSEPTKEPEPTPKPEITQSEPSAAPTEEPTQAPAEEQAAPAEEETAPAEEEPTQAPAAPRAPEATAAPAQSVVRTAAALASKTVEELIASETVTVSESVTVALRPIANAVVVNDAPEGELVVRAAVVADTQNAETDVYAAFAAAWQRDGELVAVEPMTVSIPVAVGETDDEGMSVPTEAFKLVRVDAVEGEETLTEVEFTFEDGMLTFEMDAAAVYLIIPA